MWRWASSAHAITEDVLLIVTRLLPLRTQKMHHLVEIMQIRAVS
jgi:hypothetical protein